MPLMSELVVCNSLTYLLSASDELGTVPCAGDTEGSQAHADTARVFLGFTAWWEG